MKRLKLANHLTVDELNSNTAKPPIRWRGVIGKSFGWWCADEHRIAIKPIIRRVGRKKGQRPIITVQHRYKWTYLYRQMSP